MNWSLKKPLLVCALALQTAVSQAKSADSRAEDDSKVRPPVTKNDLKIVRRAAEILNSPAKWNRADTRECPSCAKTFSLFCALKKATEESGGKWEHRSAVMQEARFVIDEVVAKGNHYEHRLMHYNNAPSTKFSDIQKVLKLMEVRISKRLGSTNSKD